MEAFISYFLWLFGGLGGLHHFYLGDDQKAFLYAISGGGFGLGWFRDMFVLPNYFTDSSADEIRKIQQTRSQTPPISFAAVVASLLFSFWFGNIGFYCLPRDLVPAWLLAVSRALGSALGAWLVFNARRFQRVSFYGCLAGAAVTIPLFAGDYDTGSMACVLATLGGMLTRRWGSSRNTGAMFSSDRSFCARVSLFSLAYVAFLLLLVCCIVMNAHVTTKDNKIVRLRTVIYSAILKGDLDEFAKFFVNASKRFAKKVSRLSGRKDHLAVLGLKETRENPVSDAQIKQAFRKLARKLHPDKGGSTEEYQRIQDAYLSLLDK